MPSSAETTLRWTRWQQTPLVQRNLAQGTDRSCYTVLYVPVYLRETFLAMVTLLLARRHLDGELSSLLDRPDMLPTLHESQTQWDAWQQWTRQLGGYLSRVAEGCEGRSPALPRFSEILATQKE